VVGFASRFRKLFLQEFVKGCEIVDPPISASPHFAEVAAQFYKLSVSLLLCRSLPGQNLIDSSQHEQSPAAIQFRCHQGWPASPQIGQSNQGRSLLAGE